MNNIKYKILLKSNFLTSQIGVIGKDIDSTFKRNTKNEPVIYGKLIKGVLRDKFSQFLLTLNEKSIVDEIVKNIFGSEGNNISKIFFSNLYLENKKEFKSSSRHSIRIDRKTKTTVEGSLFNYEFIENNQEFLGELVFKEGIKNKEILKILIASLFHIDKIGGYKSRGLGNVEVKIEYKNEYVGIEKLNEIIDTLSIKAVTTKSDKFKKYNFNLKFSDPLVLQENVIGNLVTSRTNLQGSTIRGALITRGLEKGYSIDDLLNIEVKLMSRKDNLKSVFKTKYKVSNGKYLTIDKTIIIDDKKVLNDNFGNKFERENNIDFINKSDEISIKIDYNTRTVEDNMLFNHEIIEEDNKNNEYYGNIYIPEHLLDKNDYLNIGKYKSKGFGKVGINLSTYQEEKINVEKNILEFNKLVIEKDRYYLTIDFLSDCILPFDNIYNILEQFRELINLEKISNYSVNRTFVSVEKLRGYNIINNTRKADELIIAKGSVLTYEFNNFEDLKYNLELLEEITKNGVGLRRKEGFGIIQICKLTKERRGKNV